MGISRDKRHDIIRINNQTTRAPMAKRKKAFTKLLSQGNMWTGILLTIQGRIEGISRLTRMLSETSISEAETVSIRRRRHPSPTSSEAISSSQSQWKSRCGYPCLSTSRMNRRVGRRYLRIDPCNRLRGSTSTRPWSLTE